MTDITDAGPRLKAMNDALEENARLAALVESLRREVREQRREIAGLREERRAILEADRPQPDRPEAIATGESDRPQPIATPEPLSTPGECTVPPECTIPSDDPPDTVDSVGDSAAGDGTSVETEIPPEWLAKPYWVDPPSGWRYGFPRLYDPAADGDLTAWMIRHGYPERLARQGLPCTFTACTEDGEK